MILLDRIPSPGQLIMPALTLAINLSFFLLPKLNQNKKSFHKEGKNLPQLWDGFIQIKPGYANLGLKSPLYWKQLNHTKGNQSSNTRKLGYVPYRWWCQYIISLEDKDSTEQTKSDDLRYTWLHLMEALNLSLTYDCTNTAGYVICISPVLQNFCFLHCQMCV